MLKIPTTLTDATPNVSIDKFQAVINDTLSVSRRHRHYVENTWDESYELWRSSSLDIEKSTARSGVTTGKEADWHHRVNTGKFFETVETLTAYFKSATFPSDDWFDVTGKVPELGEQARLVKELAKYELNVAKVRHVFDDFYRSLFIHGFSTVRIGWETCIKRSVMRQFSETGFTDVSLNVEESYLCLEHVQPKDIWIDTSTRLETTGTFQALHISRSEFLEKVELGEYTVDDDMIDAYDPVAESDPSIEKSANTNQQSSLIEFYGPLIVEGVRYWCVHAVLLNNKLIALEDSPYWCGSPFVNAVLLPNRDSAYGLSTLHPILGGFHVLNTITNMRLDALLLHINKMFTYVEDGILAKEDIRSKPGAVYTVASHDNLKPMDMGSTGFTVSYNEEAVAQGNVDRTTATGPLVGAGQPRGGERVTAEEIQAVRDAGGSRLTALHIRLEESATYPLLRKCFSLLQQFVIDPRTVRLYHPESDSFAFFEVLPEFLHYPYNFHVTGADYVIEKQRNVRNILDLLDIAGRVPEMSASLNYQAILSDLLKLMRFSNAQKYLKQPVQMQTGPELPGEETMDTLQGVETQQALQRSLTLDGGQGILNAGGVDTQGINPALLQQLLTQSNVPATEPNIGLPSPGGPAPLPGGGGGGGY